MCLLCCISHVYINIQSKQIHKFYLSKTKNFALVIFEINILHFLLYKFDLNVLQLLTNNFSMNTYR